MSEVTFFQRVTKLIRRLVLRSFPSCKEIVRIISASLDRPLTIRERFLMEMHLLACKPCVRYLNQSEFVSQAMRIMDDGEKIDLFSGSLSDGARTRIKSALSAAN